MKEVHHFVATKERLVESANELPFLSYDMIKNVERSTSDRCFVSTSRLAGDRSHVISESDSITQLGELCMKLHISGHEEIVAPDVAFSILSSIPLDAYKNVVSNVFYDSGLLKKSITSIINNICQELKRVDLDDHNYLFDDDVSFDINSIVVPVFDYREKVSKVRKTNIGNERKSVNPINEMSYNLDSSPSYETYSLDHDVAVRGDSPSNVLDSGVSESFPTIVNVAKSVVSSFVDDVILPRDVPDDLVYLALSSVSDTRVLDQTVQVIKPTFYNVFQLTSDSQLAESIRQFVQSRFPQVMTDRSTTIDSLLVEFGQVGKLKTFITKLER